MLLFLAGVFILAHSFIPHTHHQDHICIINSPCYNQQTSLQNDIVPDENGDGHYHVSNNKNDSRQVAVSYDKGHKHQTSELKAAGNKICTESRESATDLSPDEKHEDDLQSDIREANHSDNNDTQCRYSAHLPFEGDDHTHDGHCHTDGCALFEILVYDPLARKPVIECPCTENEHNHSEHVQAILQAGFKPPASWYNMPFRQKPHIDTYSGYNHSLIPGLRAPPVS